MGKLNHNLATSDEDKFRCFIIEKNNTDSVESYNIGQSGDASCDGLFTPKDGLRTFKIRKTSNIAPMCDFPNWLVDTAHWKSLDNRLFYDFTAGKVLSVYNERKDVQQRAKCIDSESYGRQFNTTRFVIHTTAGW